MSRIMSYSAWLSSFVLVSLASAGAVHAATETVTLKNGNTYEVEVNRRGEPVVAENGQVKITFLSTYSYALPPSNSPAYVWMWNARLKRSGAFKVTVTTPIDETVSVSFEVVGRDEIGNKYFFDSEEYPTLWTWLDEPETSWIPFVFTFEDTQSDDTFALTQWTRFDAPDKGAFLELASLTAELNDSEGTAGPQEAVASISSEATSELLPEPNQSASGNNTASVYIFRESNMRLSGQRDVYMDETPIAMLPRLSYTSAIIEPGWHLLWGDVRPEWFEFQGGRTYLLRILPGEARGIKGNWLLDDPERIQQGISEFNLQHVVLTEKSLTSLRRKLDRYSRARQDAGEPSDPIETAGLAYREEPPAAIGLYGLGGRRILTVSETAISYQSRDHELEIPMSDILNAGLYSVSSATWLAIRYREQGSIQEAYFGPIRRFGAYNRVMLAIQDPLSTPTPAESLSVLAQPATPKPTVMQVVYDACLPVETQNLKEEGDSDPELLAEMLCGATAGLCFRGETEPDEICRRSLAEYELNLNVEGTSLLNEAAHIGDRRLVEAMIEIGVDLDYPARGLEDIAPVGNAWTPLMHATAEGHEEVVSILIQAGADVNAKNELGRTSLMFSANYGFFEIAEMLLENGANADDVANDEGGWPAIIAASANGHRNIVILLLEHGADQNIRDNSGKTALMWAEERGHRRVARTLERSQ